MDFLSLYLKLFYRTQLTWESLWNEFWRYIAKKLSSSLQFNQAQSYLQEEISYPPANFFRPPSKMSSRTPLVLVDLLAHHSLYLAVDCYLPHTFTQFTVLLHLRTFYAFFCAGLTLFYCVVIVSTSSLLSFFFSHFYLPRSLWRIVTKFLHSVVVGWSVLRLLSSCTSHCLLYFVTGKLHVLCGWKHCSEEAYMNKWAKRWLNDKK